MSSRTFKSLSLFAAVMAGLIPAFFLVSGSTRLFGTVRAAAIEQSVPTPTDPFKIGFTEPIDRDDLDEDKISVFPDEPFRIEWSADRSNLLVFPEGKWSSGGKYRITIAEGRTGIAKTIPTSSFLFDVAGYPELVSITPSDGLTDVLLDIEDPITVRFDRPVREFFVDFRITPGVEVAYENDDTKTEFRLLPKEPVRPGTRYTIDIFVKWRGEPDSEYRALGGASFTTLPERPVEWAKDLVERVEQAKRFTHPSIFVGKYIDINLESQIMTLFQDGVAIDAYPVSSGKPGMETPKGEFAIRNKADKPWSKAYGLFMPNWMALVPDGKFGIHELPEWPGGYKEGANHLGIPVSHGCVRLGVGPARRVYEWAEIGTPVIIR